MKRIRKTPATISQMEVLRGIRKPMAPPSKVIRSKKAYNRKDKSWKQDI